MYRVRIQYRPNFLPDGTFVELINDETDTIIANGKFDAYPSNDCSRAMCRRIAFGRAIAQAFPDKDDRRMAWWQYFAQVRDDSDNRLGAILEQELKLQEVQQIIDRYNCYAERLLSGKQAEIERTENDYTKS